jgi:hypothetical protein
MLNTDKETLYTLLIYDPNEETYITNSVYYDKIYTL